MATITEIAQDIYRVNVEVPNSPVTYSFFVIKDDLPTLVDLLPKQAKVRLRVLQAVERLVGGRRNELIHFRPGNLAADVELDQSSVAAALRQLNHLEAFTYVPPFRGRAIRI